MESDKKVDKYFNKKKRLAETTYGKNVLSARQSLLHNGRIEEYDSYIDSEWERLIEFNAFMDKVRKELKKAIDGVFGQNVTAIFNNREK